MWIGRLRRVLNELNRECDRAASDEEIAGFEFARSARNFSRRAREMTDDKLAFSATLMRAGEVGAATRLIDDLEQDVRAQEAALVEQANGVKHAAARRRTKVTRLRLARTLAATLISAGLLTFSVAGVGLAWFLSDLSRGDGPAGGPTSGVALSGSEASEQRALRSIRLPDGTRVSLTPRQFRAFRSLAENRNLDQAELERLLIELVGPRLAGRLAEALAEVTRAAARGTGQLNTRTNSLRSRVDEADSKAGLGSQRGDGDTSPSSGDKKSVDRGHEPPEKSDGGDVIDAPLDGTQPPKPESVLSGGN